jgi:hypothetical protein
MRVDDEVRLPVRRARESDSGCLEQTEVLGLSKPIRGGYSMLEQLWGRDLLMGVSDVGCLYQMVKFRDDLQMDSKGRVMRMRLEKAITIGMPHF